MKYILLYLLFFCSLAYAESPIIWHGSLAKSLATTGFEQNDGKVLRILTVDPTAGAGVVAEIGSVGQRDNAGVGEFWLKTGAADTAWTLISSSASAVDMVQEVPAGLVDNSNTDFTLSTTASSADAIILTLDGLVQKQGVGLDYTVSGTTLTFTTPPNFGQLPYVIYAHTGVILSSGSTQEVPAGLVDNSNVTYTLANTPFSSASVILTLNGLVLKQGVGLDYTISGDTITMNVAPNFGSLLWAVYQQ